MVTLQSHNVSKGYICFKMLCHTSNKMQVAPEESLNTSRILSYIWHDEHLRSQPVPGEIPPRQQFPLHRAPEHLPADVGGIAEGLGGALIALATTAYNDPIENSC